MWSGEKGELIMRQVWGHNFPVGVQKVEEFEQCLQPPLPPGPLQTHPFAWGCCLLQAAAGEQGLVGRSVSKLCLVCVHGSLSPVTSQTKERSS